MAFKDIFEEQRKKLNNYFGLGQPGLGTFGKQISNVIKPTVSKNIQNYQKAGRYLSSQPSLAQRYTPVVGPVRSIVSDLKRPVGSSNIKQFGLGAGKEAVRNFNTMSYAPRLLSRKLYGEKVDQPVRNITNRINTAIDRRPATTWQGKTARFAGENAPYFAIPALPGAVKTGTALTRLGKNTLIRGGEGALYGGGRAMGEGKDWKGVAKDAATGFAFGAGANALLSPRVTGKALVEAKTGIQKGSQKYLRDVNYSQTADMIARINNKLSIRNVLDEFPLTASLKPSQKARLAEEFVDETNGWKILERLKEFQTSPDVVNVNYYKTSKPGFAKLPINPKKPSQPIVGANKGIDALKNEARKYKSAEEFANSKITRDYVSEVIPEKSMGTKGSSLFTKTSSARAKAREINDRVVEIAKRDQETFNLLKNKPIKELEAKLAETKKFFDEQNASHPRSERIMQYIIDEKKRLTDFYNQSLSTNKGAVTPLKVNKPQKGIRLPLKGEKATEGLVTSVPPAGKGIERGFSKTIKTAQGLPDEIQNLKSTYTPITNKATLKAAKTQLDVEKFVKSNYDQAKKRVLSGEMTAENNALGQELIRRNIDAGKFDEVDEIFNKMAEKGTSAGQYNQAFAMWSKTTPEGMLKYAKSTVDKANSQLGSVSKALRGVFGKQMPKIDEADAKFITSQMKKAQGLPEAQRIPLIQSVMDRINKKIPWGVSDVIDTYRYNNMLSNPLTHLRNAVSNLQQTFITRPATLLGQGKVKDAVKYEIGTLKALPDAVDGFVKAMKKPGQLGRLDEPMRLKPRLLGRWNTPSDLMEAGDVFFRKLIESGEKSRGTTAKEASEIAEYSLFRAPLNAKQQGVLLNKIDDVTKATYNLRKVGLGWFIPFIRTPMNVAKQWIEYSPAGFSTMVGAGNKGEQAAKATVGSLITLAGANLALQGRTTWDAPVDPKEKELFYASGRKPFSVKVGDKWVPMQTFGAFAFALGLPAAAKYYQTESRTALTDDDISKWTKIATSGLNFWSGQTFVQGLGNFVDLVQGDQDWKLSRLLAQPITQLKPMTGALSYIARLTDPVFRKASGFGDQLKQGVPGLTKGMKAYTNPLGEESRRNITDFVAPYSMGQEDTRFEQPYKERQKTLQENNLINQLKKQGKSGTAPSGRTVVQIGNEFKEFDTEQEANFAIAKEDFKKSGKNIQQYEDKVFRLQSDGDVKVQDKIDYDYSLNTNKLQRLKSSKDYKGWVETANKQLEILDKQLKDPTLDELEQSDLLEKADKILSDMAKYSEYGGFDKPKKGKKINISVPDLGSAKIPVKRAGKFAFKTSSTPKINIVSTKPKQITKSYLASIR